MTLRHATQRNKAIRVHTRHDLARKQLLLLTIEQLVALPKWPYEIGNNKNHVYSLLCMFLMTQQSGKYFHNTEIYSIFTTNYEPSELYQSKLYMEPSSPSVRGCM